MSDREQFLSRVRRQLAEARRHGHDAGAAHPGSFSGYSFAADASVEALLAQFTAELEALAGHIHPADSIEQATAAVLEILRRHHSTSALAWQSGPEPLVAVLAGLRQAGISLWDGHLPANAAARRARLAELDGVVVGVSGAHGALADTGAIALVSGPGQGRLASLLPPVHVAVLSRRQIYPSLPAFLAAQPEAVTRGSNLAFIAGPSRTGDIEMTLSMGVHGPGEVHVVVAP
ncbi:MAG: hypothetical protein Kow0031_40770 [Anaerolineae bacterium]